MRETLHKILVDSCKSHDRLSLYRQVEALAEQHLAFAVADPQPMAVTSVTYHTGANALAPEQTISLGPGLTVVYSSEWCGQV